MFFIRAGFVSLISIMIFFSDSQSFAQNNNEQHPAEAMDKIIEHQMEAIELTRSGKTRSKDDEFMKFFNEMLARQEKELKNMEMTREKLFPGIEKTPSTGERLSAFSRNIEKEFKDLENEIKSAFDKFNSRLARENKLALSPKVEIEEDKNSYDIKAEVPGLARDDINITVKKDDVIITGKREGEVRRKSDSLKSTEFFYGDFERTIHLDERVDPKSLKTEYKNGIISVHLDKLKSQKSFMN